MLCPVLGSQYKRQTSWRESNEELLDDKGASGSNETTAWTVQPGGESINMYKYLIGGVKTASTSSQLCQVTGEKLMGKNTGN